MSSIVELIHELKGLSEAALVQRFGLSDFSVAQLLNGHFSLWFGTSIREDPRQALELFVSLLTKNN